MAKASVHLDKYYQIDSIDPRLFGGFAEHLGRCIYGGIYEPTHPQADEDGFRKDVIELVRELNMPVVRYPGGNFVSGYNWEDGVGPRELRPKRLELAWRSIETNEIGINEFVKWCRKVNAAPMITVNLGTRDGDAARTLVEYCNHPNGTTWSDLRRQHGFEKPHNIKLWCLGNEMDGSWQMGAKTAQEYARLARETAKLMKWTDPTIELVACGSSSRSMPTFPAWEAEVLEHTLDVVDYISLHMYCGSSENDFETFLARAEEMARYIEEVIATCDYVAAKCRSRKRLMLSFDEWNVWHPSATPTSGNWEVAPSLLEEKYRMIDALMVGSMLITLMNHADRVKIACLAQVVNVIAPILTIPNGPAWRQTIFWPFAHASQLGKGIVLKQLIDSTRYGCSIAEDVPHLTSCAITNPEHEDIRFFCVNRSLTEELDLIVQLNNFDQLTQVEWTLLQHADLQACNTAENPNNVTPKKNKGAVIEGKTLRAKLPPASWNVFHISK